MLNAELIAPAVSELAVDLDPAHALRRDQDGGLSWLARKHGLAANNVTAIELVTEEPMPYLSASAVLGPLDDAALDTVAAHVQPGAPLMFAELRQLGGAVGRVPEGAGAAGSFDGDYVYFAAGLMLGPEMAQAVKAAGARARAALAPYDTGSAYFNFTEEPTDPSAFYAEESYERLRAVRAVVDPHGVMVGNHPIPAA